MVIVRLVTQNCMVTKGYRKGVYRRVTEGIWCVPGFQANFKAELGTPKH